MKKILLLCSIIIAYCFSVQAQSLEATPATVNSGQEVTFKGTNENNGGYFVTIASASINPGTAPITITLGDATFFNTTTQTATQFKYKFVNSSNSPQNIIVNFTLLRANDNGGTPGNYGVSVSITVNGNNPTPTTYYNDAMSKVFYNNTCGAGFSSDPYDYQVLANTYSSTISKADANSKAQAEINTSGQASANLNRPCKVEYSSAAASGSYVRNNCGSTAVPGPAIAYSVPAGKYKSTISQADADAKAQADLATNGQANANAVGTCTPVPYILGNSSGFRGQDNYFSVSNTSPGDSFVWSVTPANAATIKSGQGTTSLITNFNNIGGTQPFPITINVRITSASGASATYSFNTTSKFCSNCPQN